MSAGVPFLFASDLDGTLLPNTGKLPDSGCLERTQALLRTLIEADCPVCVVSGRYLALAKQGQAVFRLPQPTWWICNVGTEVYDQTGAQDREWQSRLGPPLDREALRRSLYRISRLAPQEPQKQGPHKFSFYYPEPVSRELLAEIMYRVRAVRNDLQMISSIEESSGRALLDIIPANAGKSHALWYVAERYGLAGDRIFFAGDSGNDLDALLSGVCGVLVGNTPADVRAQASEQQKRNDSARLFIADAFYGDGIIQGLRHYGLWPLVASGSKAKRDTQR
jgi:sucrose-6F-phosphate phosphohydrolase